MTVETAYVHLEPKPERSSEELHLRGTGIRASTIWHDRYVSRMTPEQVATDRDVPMDAVQEALRYCQEHWEAICEEKDAERARLQEAGFFEPQMTPAK